MRWERLFGDLEAQFAAAAAAELTAEVADRTRREVARLRLVDRLDAATGDRLDMTVAGAGTVRGVLRRVGPDWALLDVPSQPGVLVALSAVEAVRGLSARAREPGSEGAVLSRLSLGYALRGIARDRSPVAVVCRDGATIAGTIDRVGADFLDLAEHPAGEPRRARQVTGTTVVTFSAIAVVRPSR